MASIPDLSLTDAQQARVASLTAKEREVLRGWLDHRTAKEMALEHGISHHAVEKRLKAARDRLGVATSIEAARMLAAVEGYGRTAAGAPEMAAATAEGQQEASGRDEGMPPRRGRTVLILTGVFVMSLSLLALFASGFLSLGTASSASQSVTTIDKRTAPPGALDAAFDSAFRNLDKDGSGFLEGKELTSGNLRVARTAQGGTSAMKTVSFTEWNTDGDNRLSPAEFRKGMNALAGQLR